MGGQMRASNNPVMTNILAPLAAHYDDPQTIELRLGRAGVVIVERREQGKFEIDDHELGVAQIEKVCQSLANVNGLRFDADEAPKVSCVLPEGHRFECLVGSSVQSGLSLAIRCKHPFMPSWAQVGADQRVKAWLVEAVASERNIIVSGATNTGKTTLLNKLLATLPADRRVVSVEDTPELQLDRFWDGVGLLAAREAVTAAGRVSVHRVALLSRPIIPGEAGKQVSRGCVFRVSGSMWARNTKGELGAYFIKASIVHAPRVSSPNVVDFDINWAGLDEPMLAQSPRYPQPPKAE